MDATQASLCRELLLTVAQYAISRSESVIESRSVEFPAFEYPPLPSENHIRLLKLNPGRPEDDLDCWLETHDPDDNPSYTAITYTWGQSWPRTRITLNGCDKTVGPNLAWGLYRTRRPDSAIVLWIDALCINQADETEKSQQVLRMRRIYENAVEVLIWLGPDGDNIGTSAIPLLQRIERFALPGSANRSLRTLAGTILREIDLTKTWEELDLPETGDIQWLDLLFMLSLPVFERIWIVQEITVAKNARVYYGRWELDWLTIAVPALWLSCTDRLNVTHRRKTQSHYLNSLKDWLWREKRSLDDPFSIVNNIAILCLLSGMTHPRFDVLLLMSKTWRCQDPRDKVFAIVGVAGEWSASASEAPTVLRPDYSKSVLDVYMAATRFVIGDLVVNEWPIGQRLVGLWSVYEHPEPGWPTWVPHWQDNSKPRFNKDVLGAVLSSNSPALLLRDVGSDKILSLRGILAGVVKDADCWALGDRDSLDFQQAGWEFLQRVLIKYCESIITSYDMIAFLLALTSSDPYLNTDYEDWFLDFLACIRRLDELRDAAWADDALHHTVEYFESLIKRFFNKSHSNGDPMRFWSRLGSYTALLRSQNGRFGATCATAQPGDLICVIYGCPALIVLHPDGEHYTFVGLCFCPGLGLGELDKRARGEPVDERWFDIH